MKIVIFCSIFYILHIQIVLAIEPNAKDNIERIVKEDSKIEYENQDYMINNINKVENINQLKNRNKEYIFALKAVNVNGCPQEFVELRQKQILVIEKRKRDFPKQSNVCRS